MTPHRRRFWLIDILLQYKSLTLKDINRLWENSYLNETGESIPTRSFHQLKHDIFDSLGIEIICDNRNRYSIAHPEELTSNSVAAWLINSTATYNQLQEHKNLQGRIIYENIPSGQHWLNILTEAIYNNNIVSITYQSFSKDNPSTFMVEPYALKVCTRRWYLMGRSPEYSDASQRDVYRTYALDRILNVELTSQQFLEPMTSEVSTFFDEFYGVLTDDSVPLEDVMIKAYGRNAKYIESLPFHHSQETMEQNKQFTVFRLHIRPTYDLFQSFLSFADGIEIVEPLWVRERVAELTRKTLERYAQKAD